MRILSLLGCLALFVTLTSCIEEGSDSILISSESGLTQEQVDNDNRAISTMAYGYIHGNNVIYNSDELNTFNVSLTAEDVRRGDRLTGTSNMMVVHFMKFGSDLTGTYEIMGNEATREKGIAFVNYCTNMDFSRGTADDDIPFDGGSITITEDQDGNYKVAYQGSLQRRGQTAAEFVTDFAVVE